MARFRGWWSGGAKKTTNHLRKRAPCVLVFEGGGSLVSDSGLRVELMYIIVDFNGNTYLILELWVDAPPIAPPLLSLRLLVFLEVVVVVATGRGPFAVSKWQGQHNVEGRTRYPSRHIKMEMRRRGGASPPHRVEMARTRAHPFSLYRDGNDTTEGVPPSPCQNGKDNTTRRGTPLLVVVLLVSGL